jgi:hypothetical protein
MSECCGSEPAGGPRECARCGIKGTAVELQTVKALLTEAALARLSATRHRFCAETTCPVVYFDDDGQMFLTGDVRVPVWQKQAAGKRIICYCFGESESRIRADLEGTAATMAVERVRAHIAARRCACEIRNPKGSCCLGDLIAAVKRIEAETAAKAE